MSEAKEYNKDMRYFFLTSGWKEPVDGFTEKPLDLCQISENYSSVPIYHFYSDAINRGMKIFRFYAHVSVAQDRAPVLWLSYRQYKTCRAGHKYFQAISFIYFAEDKVLAAKWRNTTFLLSSDYKALLANTHNTTDDMDPWFWTQPGAKSSRQIDLHAGRHRG